MERATRLRGAEYAPAVGGRRRASCGQQFQQVETERMGQSPDRLRVTDLHMPKDTLGSENVKEFFEVFLL
jgi:hypothetical protein